MCIRQQHIHPTYLSSLQQASPVSLLIEETREETARLEAMAILTRSLAPLRTYLGSLTWAPFVQLSRSTVLGLLNRIEIGQLVVTDSDGMVTICGHPGIKDGSPRTELKVLKEAFWVRAILFADMVGELVLLLRGARHARLSWTQERGLRV